MKAIDTSYNGYLFRSRLEARWAVFFDGVGVRYEYEPEGFELQSGEWYLPDFYLPDLCAYIEIKPAGFITFTQCDDEHLEITSAEHKDYLPKLCHAVNAFLDDGKIFAILEGDPLDVLAKNHGGNGDGWIWARTECAKKLFPQEDIVCEKKDGTIPPDEECKACDFYRDIAIPFCGFGSAKRFLHVEGVFKDMHPININSFDVFYDHVGDGTPWYITKMLQSAERARKARF